tara:strand:+ start:18888 stop:19652 length:765 start_codon:yes stop_codon:yes gene_type:complete
MSLIKTPDEIKILKEAGNRLSRVLVEVGKAVVPGITTQELDDLGEKLIRDGGDVPAFKDYTPEGANTPFPATVCISVNDEIVHGIPGDYALKEGDIVGLDIGLIRDGKYIVDMARTYPVGAISDEDKKLLEVTKRSLFAGIKNAIPGKKIGAIGSAIEAVAKEYGYGVVEVLGGHGVGHAVHEEPFIPNFGSKNSGPEIQEGMVLALEPMLTRGTKNVILKDDGYTYATKDGTNSAHFEHTIAITKKGPVILTE